jgi:hypothetical protein
MYFMALASDYDGTLAAHGAVGRGALAAVERLKASGRKFILVTGRELPELRTVFPEFAICDLIVAENGGVLFVPQTGEERSLAPAPPPEFIEALVARGIAPLSVGNGIVASRQPNEVAILEVIRELGLEMQIIFNKGAVMVVPSGVNKATGLAVALGELALSPHNVIGIGDAENDHAFLRYCACGIAVADALPAVREAADLVTAGGAGAGVVEAIDQLLEWEEEGFAHGWKRHQIVLAEDRRGEPVCLPPRGNGLLVAGTSGSGKSTLTAGLLERLAEAGFQFCVLDPEGDYSEFEGAVVLGDGREPPGIDEALDVLHRPANNLVVNMLALDIADRPDFFANLLARLRAMRNETGRPHWIVVDEAHHMLPKARASSNTAAPRQNVCLITVHPEEVAADALRVVDHVIAIGHEPASVIEGFCRVIGETPPAAPNEPLAPGRALVWSRARGTDPLPVNVVGPRQERRRHTRKYAEGDLGQARSFHFRGPKGELNLRAQNLALFLQMAEGVDDATWLHHLRAGDYSRWFRTAIKDDDLADEAAAIEAERSEDAAATRRRVREAINRRYTAESEGSA